MTATAKKKQRVPDGILNSKPKTGLHAVKLAAAGEARPARAAPEKFDGATYYVTPSQKAALWEESVRRARNGEGTVNASRVLREFLDDCLGDWLKRQAR